MVSKREEDRRFQIELLKTEVDLENMMTWLVGALAFEFAAFVYYGEIGQVTLQLIIGIILVITAWVFYPLTYERTKKRRFNALEEQFIAKKKEKQKKEG